MQLASDDARLLHWIDRAFPKPRPKKIAIAVSGGSDSLALLHLFQRWSAQTKCPIAAVTVDHGLREGSAQEAAAVAQYCSETGTDHQILKWGEWDGHGNLQARAREARYGLMADWALQNDIDGIALGHTKNDNAENYVLRLARKSGIDGLASMARNFQRGGVVWSRPLSTVSRADLRAYLQRHNVSWTDDPSNENTEFERVRVRQALNQLEDLGISADALLHAGHAARQARDAIDHYVCKEAMTRIRTLDGDLILGDVSDLPAEIQRRLWTNAVHWVGALTYRPRASSIEHMRSGVALEGKATAGGCVAVKNSDGVRFSREENAVKTLSTSTTNIWDKRWRLDGPHADGLEIRALGEGIRECPDWRETGMPRASLLASPAVWSNDTLIAAPIAVYFNGWTAEIVADFNSWLVTH